MKNVSLHLAEGEIVTLIGANGAGKTTLLNSLSGVVPTRSGQIIFNDAPINNLPVHQIVRLGISQVPEGRQVFKPVSVEDNLELGSYLHHRILGGARDVKKIKRWFMICSPSSGRDENSWPEPCPAESSRCWLSAALS